MFLSSPGSTGLVSVGAAHCGAIETRTTMTTLDRHQTRLLRRVERAGAAGIVVGPKDAMTLGALMVQGFVTSEAISEDRSATVITDAGRAALGTSQEADAEVTPGGPAPPPATLAPKGKIGTLVALLRDADGATIEAMMSATGWQAHSVRGAMSGWVKKALSLTITSEKVDGVRVYRIVEGAGV